MAQPIEPQSETLTSALPSIETPSTDIIVAGGPSGSEKLNRLRRAVVRDVATLDQRTDDNATQISLVNGILQSQVAAIASRINALAARIPTTTNRWMADFFTNSFTYHTNTAEVNPTYGQATLPILSAQEKLVGEDSQGKVWIPNGAQLQYAYTAGTPNEVDWLTDSAMTRALDQRVDTAWWRDRATSGSVWVRVKLPVNLAGNKQANTIILHPFPVLFYDLVSIETKNPAGVWTTQDLSYLQGYNSSRGIVEWVGNIRLFIPASQVTEVRVKLNTANLWGFAKVSVQQTEFNPSATLVTDFLQYSPSAITRVTVFGKDQDALSYLTTSVNGTLVSVSLSQTVGNASPVITQLEARP